MVSFLKKTSEGVLSILGRRQKKVDKGALGSVLIECDVDCDITDNILASLGDSITRDELRVAMCRYFRGDSYYDKVSFTETDRVPKVYLLMGVNGAGKTTTVGKLAKMFKRNGKKVILGACDTFRAAAAEQLSLWSDRVGVDIVLSKQVRDPSALAFDTVNAAVARGCDYALIDSAGRLHNKANLRNELAKMSRTCSNIVGVTCYNILVLDGTQGTSGIEQAAAFHDAVGVDAVVVTKMDGSSKGGSVLSIVHKLGLPVSHLCTGEGEDDIVEFDSDRYVEGLLDSIFD